MARQKGIIQLEGTLGGINFYSRKGKPLARKAGGGFTAKAIKNSPTMVRVRENNTEFGNCSRIKKLFKMALHPFFGGYKDVSLHGRMMQLLQQIKSYDAVSERGKRTVGNGIATPMGALLFQNFDFTPKRPHSLLLAGKCSFDWDFFCYTVTNFDLRLIPFPAAATHLEFRLGVLLFDFTTLDSKMHLGAPMLLGRDFAGSSFSLCPEPVPNGTGKRFAFVGVQFYQEVGGEMYLLKEEGAHGLELVGLHQG